MEEKKKYVKPTTEVVVLQGDVTILAASSDGMFSSLSSRDDTMPTAHRDWDVVNSRAEAYLTRGKSSSRGGKQR